MNPRELATVISEALEDIVRIDTTPKVKKDFASLECEDEEGNAFIIRVIKLASEEDEDADEDPVVVEEGDDAEL